MARPPTFPNPGELPAPDRRVMAALSVLAAAVMLGCGNIGNWGAKKDKSTESESRSSSPTTAPTKPPSGGKFAARFLGKWEYVSREKPRKSMAVEFVNDMKAMNFTVIVEPNINQTIPVRCEVLEETAERVDVTMYWEDTAVTQKSETKWGLELLPNGDMRVNFLLGSGAPITYKRVR
jgi:hypothetical protein